MVANVAPAVSPAGGAGLDELLSCTAPGAFDLASRLLAPLADIGPSDAATRSTPENTPARSQLLAAAEQVMRNRVELLGGYGHQSLGEPIDWSHAPGGDLQWPTHLSRHYWLLPVARAYRVTGEPRYAAKVVDVLSAWVAQNPPDDPRLEHRTSAWAAGDGEAACRTGALEGFFPGYADGPWTSLSAHFRFDAWAEMFQLIHDAPAMTNAAVAPLLASLLGPHVRIMLGFPRRMNQYLAIAASLIGCGWYFPAFAGAGRCEAVGWARLRAWALAEIYPDGSLAECSPNYGVGCVMRLHRVAQSAERRGRTVAPEVRQRLAAATRYIAHTADPTRRSPRLAKGGQCVIGPLRALNEAVGDAAVAAIIDESAAGQVPAPTSRLFTWAGHAVARSDWSADAVWLFFDMGPRGSGHHDLAQLGLQLRWGGTELLSDPGFYTYGRVGQAGRISEYLSTTAAHNCALIDGHGQVGPDPDRLAGPNRSPGRYAYRDDGVTFRAAATYRGGFGPAGEVAVAHRRRVTYDRAAATVAVDDRFAGAGRHACTLHWQLPPDARVTVGPDGLAWRVGNVAVGMSVGCAAPVTVERVSGRHEPPLGWYSAKYGDLRPATTVCVSTTAQLPLPMRTLFTLKKIG